MFQNALIRWIASLYSRLTKLGGNLESIFLLWMRLTWGHQFILSGAGKLANIEKTIQFFTSLGISHPDFHAHLVGYTEVIGGAFLMIGFASRLAAIPLIITMITALSTAHAEKLSGFKFLFDPSLLAYEAPYPFLITALLVFIFGPGRISVDGWLKRWASRQPKY